MASSFRSFLPIRNVLRKDCSSDEEYMTRISLEFCLPENRAAAMRLLAADTRSRCFRVVVEGYDTSLSVEAISSALCKLFECKGIVDIEATVDPVTGLLNRHAFLYIRGKDEEELALARNGTDAGGWRAIAKAAPLPRDSELLPTEEELIKLRTVYHQKNCSTPLWVEGYDILLPEDEVKNALIKHFCSCGVMADLSIFRDPLTQTLTSMAFLYFYGEEKLAKALALHGTDVGGWTVSVKRIPGLVTSSLQDQSGGGLLHF